MVLRVSGSLSSPQAFGRAIEAFGRRSISQQLRRQGELAGQLAEQMAATELGPPRFGNRRRTSGPHYHTGFRVLYSGFDDFAHGDMTVTVSNLAPHAKYIEEGFAGGYVIRPRSPRGRIRYPYAPYASPGPPWEFRGKPGQGVTHGGVTGRRILKRAATQAIIQRLGGRTLGHARIRIKVH